MTSHCNYMHNPPQLLAVRHVAAQMDDYI